MTSRPKVPKEATLGVCLEFSQDSTNREKYGKPFVNFPDPIDTHPNEEDHEIAFDFSGHEVWNDPRHTLRLRGSSTRAPTFGCQRAILVRLDLPASVAPAIRCIQ